MADGLGKVRILVLAAAGFGLAGGSALAATRTWTGASGNTVWFNAANWSGGECPTNGDAVILDASSSPRTNICLDGPTPPLGSLEIVNAQLLFTNWDTTLLASNVWIRPNGRLTLPAAFTNGVMSNRVRVVCTTFVLEEGGWIDADVRGYMNACGPGAGATGWESGAGAGYGGQGGRSYNYGYGGVSYGTVAQPEEPGSGGGNMNAWSVKGGNGGGAVRIEALESVTVNGVITANGGLGASSRGGGGSGGSIAITCVTFAGYGVLSANGGNGAYDRGGGGGGGRIAVSFTHLASPCSVRFSTRPGTGWDAGAYPNIAAPGTVWLPNTNLLTETLSDWLFDGVRLVIPGFASWETASLAVSNCSVTFAEDGFRLTVTHDLTIGTNGWLGLGTQGVTGCVELVCGGDLALKEGGCLSVVSGETNEGTAWGARVAVSNAMSVASGSWVRVYANLTNGGAPVFHLGSLRVEGGTNGGFEADGKGYAYTLGPGAGATGWESAGGGGYGGEGGRSYNGQSGGPVYGSWQEPCAPGSGGGNMGAWSLHGGNGGGVVWIEALEDVFLNGTLTARGGNGMGSRAGGGSGGGIHVLCETFSGSGFLKADGGHWGGDRGGGGGGGRISVWYEMPGWARAKFRAGAVSRGVFITNSCPNYSGQMSVNPGSGYLNLPNPNGAYPGTGFFVRYWPAGTVLAVY